MKYVYRFSEGGTAMVDLLGGKGANRADMAQPGLPVPPAFTITTGPAWTTSPAPPLRVPIARLTTTQAALGDGQREDV